MCVCSRACVYVMETLAKKITNSELNYGLFIRGANKQELVFILRCVCMRACVCVRVRMGVYKKSTYKEIQHNTLTIVILC